MVSRVIKDCKQPPFLSVVSYLLGPHATMQVACSVITKPNMVPTDILVSFPFSPLLGTLTCTF